jgi:hypothetical protein
MREQGGIAGPTRRHVADRCSGFGPPKPLLPGVVRGSVVDAI